MDTLLTENIEKINEIGKVVSAKELNLIVKKGILRRVGKGRALRYELND